MPLKLSRALVAVTAATVVFTASACSTNTPVSPPITQLVGKQYASWGATGAPDADDALEQFADENEPVMITSTGEWDAWLAALPPELAERSLPYRPGFEEAVMVIGSYDECGAEPQVMLLDNTVLKFNVWVDPDVECAEDPGTTIEMTLVEFDEIAATSHDDITFTF